VNIDRLRQQIADFLGFTLLDSPVSLAIEDVVDEDGYTRQRVSYPGREGDAIPAFLLLPPGDGPFPAVLVHHQHAGLRHLGKSEVCGLAGDPWQAFGPALARRGMVVLAPDAICFEDRRRGVRGIEPHEDDVAQHYDEMCYRLLRGDTLMRKVLDDSAVAVSLLQQHPLVDPDRVGLAGHSMGGSTTLFHAALDGRIAFAFASGAAGSYRHLMAHQVGIEMSRAIPGFAARFDIDDLVRCMAPRPLLLVSADGDSYSMDAEAIVNEARPSYAALGAAARLAHARYHGGHPLTEERFNRIVGWLAGQAGA
jgi:dienelactone hydrolase